MSESNEVPTLDELRLVAACGITLLSDMKSGGVIDIDTASGIVGTVARVWQHRIGPEGYARAFATETVKRGVADLLLGPAARGGTPTSAELLALAYYSIRLVDAFREDDADVVNKMTAALSLGSEALIGRYGSEALLGFFDGGALMSLYDAIPSEYRVRPS